MVVAWRPERPGGIHPITRPGGAPQDAKTHFLLFLKSFGSHSRRKPYQDMQKMTPNVLKTHQSVLERTHQALQLDVNPEGVPGEIRSILCVWRPSGASRNSIVAVLAARKAARTGGLSKVATRTRT